MEAPVSDAAATEAPRRPTFARTVLPPLAAFVVLGALLWPHADEVWRAARLVSWEAAGALVVLHLVALLLRAEAWGMCVAAAGSPVGRRDLHSSSSFRFLADTIVPTYVGAWVRIAMLKKLDPVRAPTVGQMVTADVILLLVEAGITLVLITAAVGSASVDWWLVPAFAGVLAVVAAIVWSLRARFRDRPFVKTFRVLSGRRRRATLVALLAAVLMIQPMRFLLALEAVGLDASAVEALATFLITNVYAVLPVGPGPSSIGAGVTVFGDGALAEAGAAGLILASAAVIAAGLYSTYGGVALARRRRPPPDATPAPGPTEPSRETPSMPLGSGR